MGVHRGLWMVGFWADDIRCPDGLVVMPSNPARSKDDQLLAAIDHRLSGGRWTDVAAAHGFPNEKYLGNATRKVIKDDRAVDPEADAYWKAHKL